MKIPIKKWQSDAKLPKIAKIGDAGADCYIHGFKKIKNSQNKELIEIDDDEYTLQPLERILCPLGFATAIPEGYYAAVVPRSGLALWQGLSIVNSPGTIDAGYRNEWGAIVVNLSNSPVTLHKGDKICQLIIRKLVDYEFEEVETLPISERGLGGFGSTGK
ncbi:MAG: dUTP diphosphatase [Candidatus Lokiarchaeota archaeon]|nr:dUTP diphosphatase [Candidatus Harpocratesius repetitus]